MRNLLILALALSACGTGNQTLPPAPADTPPQEVADAAVNEWLTANLKDPYSVRDLTIGKPQWGSYWTGLQRRGSVPSWYVCTQYNAKNSFGAYVGLKPHVFYIENGRVAWAFEGRTDDWHKFSC